MMKTNLLLFKLMMIALLASVCTPEAIAQPTPPLQGNWTLTFEDNFDEDTLDGEKWRLGQHYAGIAGDGGNSPEQVTLEDGILKITVKEESTPFSGSSYDYATGEISTFKAFRQQYGYYECRMRYHAVTGMWPAFWLMPDRETYGWDGKYRRSYLKFDLSGISAGSIASAELRLTPVSVQSGGQENVIVMKCPDDSWTESGLNWNNMPAPDPLWLAQYYNNITANTPLVIDVTDYINGELAGDETASFTLADQFMRDRLVTFASREHGTTSYRPHLIIDGQTIYPVADTFARKSTPTTNYGTDGSLQVADGYDDASNTFGNGNEVDIMETLGIWGPDRTQHAVLYWENGKYEFYVDGIKTSEWVNSEVMTSKAFIILSLQLGGWDQNNVGSQVDGRSMEVDYVRVWSGTKTGASTPGGGEGAAPAYTEVSVLEDTYVRSGSYATTNYGSAGNMAVKRLDSSDYARHTFMKFDVSGLDPDAERIELVLDPVSGPSPRDTLIYVRNVDNDSWSESTMNWNNQPAYGDLGNTRIYATTDIDFVVDVTNIVREQINGDGIATIRLSAANDQAYSSFYSRESTGTAAYLRATPAVGGTTTATNTLTVEAESASGQSSFGPFQVVGDYIVVPNGAGNANGGSVTASDGIVAYSFELSEAANVTVDVHVDFPSGADDSFWYKMDSGSYVQQNYDTSSVHSYTFYGLSAGTHTFTMARREDGAAFDYLVFTSSAGTVVSANPGGGSSSNTLTVEAETASGQSSFGPFQVVNGAIVVPNGTGGVNWSSVTESDGIASYNFILSETGNVTVDLHVDFPNSSDDSFWYKMDSGSYAQQNFDTSSVQSYTFYGLSAGSHTFTIARREDGAAFDYLVFTTSAGTVSQ
jgi:beta-glucanase (GH16 family)